MAKEPKLEEFRLIAGQHIQRDPTQDKVPVLFGPDGAVLREEHPRRVYRAGETVQADYDLVERFGAEKFQYVHQRNVASRAEAREVDAGNRLAVHPAGQVIEGHPTAAIQGNGGEPGPFRADTVADKAAAQMFQQRAVEAQQKAQAGYTKDELDAMTVADLKDLAASDEVDLKGATHKDDIVKALYGARGAKTKR